VGIGSADRVNLLKRNSKHEWVARHYGIYREVWYKSSDYVACQWWEVQMIAEMETFRGDTDIACNRTMGGEGNLGWQPSVETRAKIRAKAIGRKYSPEVNLKKGRKGHKQSPEAIAKQKAAAKGRPSPLRGKKQSAEAIANRSAALKGKNKGKKMSPESNARRSAALKGRKGKKHSPESIEKCRVAQLGKKQSLETIAKRVATRAKNAKVPRNKGKPAWNKGVPSSPEAKAKNRAAQLGKKQSPETKAKRQATRAKNAKIRSDKGKKQSLEALAHRAALRKLNGTVPWNKGKKLSPEELIAYRITRAKNAILKTEEENK
jgi:hypothetical protein